MNQPKQGVFFERQSRHIVSIVDPIPVGAGLKPALTKPAPTIGGWRCVKEERLNAMILENLKKVNPSMGSGR